MDAQQQFFTELKMALIDAGFDVYDTELPPESVPYPFVYLAGSTQTYYPAKGQEAGYITQIIQVWGRADERGLISATARAVISEALRIESTDDYGFIVRLSDTETQILDDTTTAQPLMQAFISMSVFFSRR